MPKPVLDYTPSVDAPKPISLVAGAPKKWCFSFRYWRQRQYLGLDHSDVQWLTSLLERLQLLSNEEVERFLRTPAMKDALRYHNINWNQRNIPVSLKDLNWIPAYYRDNPECPLVQFQISRTLGRVIGFWDERWIFNVVFLDPLHNMQPTKDTGYRLDDCGPLGCDYTRLLHAVQATLESCCKKKGCNCSEGLASIQTRKDFLEALSVVMLKLPDSDMKDVEFLQQSVGPIALYDIFRCGLDAKVLECMEASESNTSVAS